MKKRLFATIVCACLIMTGCSNEFYISGGSSASSVSVAENSAVSVSEDTALSAESSGEVPDTESSVVQTSDTSATVASAEPEKTEQTEKKTFPFEPVLMGEAKIKYVADRDFGTYVRYGSLVEDGGEYTLKEIIEAARAYMVEDWGGGEDNLGDTVAEWAYIDCGGDGVSELLVRYTIPFYMENWVEYLLIRDMGKGYEMCFADDEWSRKTVEFGKYGYVRSNGSNGAASHCWDAGFIDSEGEWHFLFACDSDIYYELTYEGVEGLWLVVFRVNTDNANTYDDYENLVLSYGVGTADVNVDSAEEVEFFYWPVICDEAVYAEGSDAREFMDEFIKGAGDIKVVTIHEVEEMILAKEKVLGITGDLRDNSELRWYKYDYTLTTD